jgi:LAO/AO transport system kinase
MESQSKESREKIIQKVLAGNARAVAQLITIVENDPGEALPYLRQLFRHAGNCFSIGITGAPGAGKSTLVDQLAQAYRKIGKKVGIIAIDPSSPFTGGAILGDRIRMQSHRLDPGIFIRSMATRGRIGGLTRATEDVLTVMDSAGFEIVFIETVGVGQGEVEVAKTADATIVLLVPGMGDDIQLMKAGIMEIGDLFVINKADYPGAEKLQAGLQALLSMNPRSDGWNPYIVRTVATEGNGIEECRESIDAFRDFLNKSGRRRIKSVQLQKNRLLELVTERITQTLLNNKEAEARIQELASDIETRKLDPFTAAEELLDMLCPDRSKNIIVE